MMTLNAIVLFAIVCTRTFLRQTQKTESNSVTPTPSLHVSIKIHLAWKKIRKRELSRGKKHNECNRFSLKTLGEKMDKARKCNNKK